MNAPALTRALNMLLLTEVRLRMRRTGTLVALLALIVLTWLMVGGPAMGYVLISVDEARVAYTSDCMALGTALLAGLVFGLAGFYLVRGRMAEDVRSGTGSVLAATPVGNAIFLLGRWLGSVAYLVALLLAFFAAALVLHALRGEGPIQPGVYLRTYALVLVPMVFFTASMAVLWDAWPPLMGRGGDVLYFLLFLSQLGGVAAVAGNHAQWSPLLAFDFSGVSSVVLVLQAALGGADPSIGASTFDPALASVLLPDIRWPLPLVATRLACALIAMLPLLPAVWLFHRFDPGRVKARAGAAGRWSPLPLLNRWLLPLARTVRPLFALAARIPGVPGYALAVVALTLASNPAAIAAVLAFWVAGCLAPTPALGAVIVGALAVWGILVSDVSVRDRQHDVGVMSGAAPGGGERRFAAQLLAACLLALAFTAPVLLRWLVVAPLRAAALLTGVLALAGASMLLGRLSGTARTFLALFLFGLYVATQATTVPALDVAGFNGVANAQTVTMQLLAGLLLAAAGIWHEQWRAARN